MRMVLESELGPEVFESVKSVVSGTAPLDPDVADAFTERFGVPVLSSYGATEFGGGVAGWNLSDYQQFGRAKRGSVGRPHPGCNVRVENRSVGRACHHDVECDRDLVCIGPDYGPQVSAALGRCEPPAASSERYFSMNGFPSRR